MFTSISAAGTNEVGAVPAPLGVRVLRRGATVKDYCGIPALVAASRT